MAGNIKSFSCPQCHRPVQYDTPPTVWPICGECKIRMQESLHVFGCVAAIPRETFEDTIEPIDPEEYA